MNQFLNNERGNGVLLTIFNFAVVGVLLILLLNITMLYTKKEQAGIAAEQASLAATSVIYEKVGPIVEGHVKEIEVIDDEGNIIILKEPLIDKLNAIKASMAGTNLSKNEIHTKAINQVLINELLDDDKLQVKISNALQSARNEIPEVIKSTIKKNKGKDEYTEFEWFLNEDQRIEVVAKTEFESADYSDIDFGDDGDISQRGIGPSISFIEKSGWLEGEYHFFING